MGNNIYKNNKKVPYTEGFFLSRKNLFKAFKDRMGYDGLINTLKRLNSKKLRDYFYEIIGIFDGEYAYKGPFHVQIDLTNDCNNNCIGCWCNSPLLGKKALDEKSKKEKLSPEVVKGFLSELSEMGTRELYFSGGGEPFMHPSVMDILRYAKRKGFICYINTNFTLLSEEKIDEIIDIGIQYLTVSLWSGTAETYSLTHPNKGKETFKRIVKNLKYLNKKKNNFPHVKLYNVIFNSNYHEIKKMLDFARRTCSESVEFTVIDTIPGKTDKLLLNNSQFKELKSICKELYDKMDENNTIKGVKISRFDSFLRRISSYKNIRNAKYDKNIIDSLPCYIGWLFTRVLPKGDVNPCLKSHRFPVGNLYENSFKKIWNGSRQRYFRKKTKVYEKNSPFFKLIGNDENIKEAGCYKSCDDIGRNLYMQEKLNILGPVGKSMFSFLSRALRGLRNW